MKKKLILLLLPMLLLTGSLSAGDLTKQLADTKTALEGMGKPYYKITNISQVAIQNPALGKQGFSAFRVILSGTPLKHLPGLQEDQTAARRLNIPEIIDLILIPVDNGVFRLDKSLGLSEPTTQKETQALFYEQYGFQWRKLDSNLKRYTLYVGKNEHFHCFAAGNLSFLLHLQIRLKFQDGFSPVEYLTEALTVNDFYNTTSATALHQLPMYGNACLPYLEQGINAAFDEEELLSHYFQVIAKINTPEAHALMNKYATDDQDDELLTPLFDTIIAAKLIKPELLPCYRLMLRKQHGIEFACAAMDKCQKVQELKIALRQIVEQPRDYSKFRFALMALEAWSNPAAIPKHKEAQEQVMLLLLRGGDMPGTVAFQNVEESDAARESRLRKEDEARLQPVMDYLLKSSEHRLTILMAFDLSLMDENALPKASRRYAFRVRDTGRKILLEMMKNPSQKREIAHYIRTLVTYTQNKRELELFRELAQKLQISVPARSIL